MRIAPDLHRRLRSRAGGEGISLNSLCARLLEAGLSDPVVSARAVPSLDPGLLEAIGRERALDLARDHLERASTRLKALEVLYAERSWADVVRESQEIVELALKGLLRRCDIEAPRVPDVSDVLRDNSARLPKTAAAALDELCEISRRLHRDRELAFYGSEDLTPSEFYRETDARDARRQARRVVEVVTKAFAG